VKVPEICIIRAYKSPQPWKTNEKNPWETHRFKDLAGDLLSECRTREWPEIQFWNIFYTGNRA
jgi:hypothetical protein